MQTTRYLRYYATVFLFTDRQPPMDNQALGPGRSRKEWRMSLCGDAGCGGAERWQALQRRLNLNDSVKCKE